MRGNPFVMELKLDGERMCIHIRSYVHVTSHILYLTRTSFIPLFCGG